MKHSNMIALSAAACCWIGGTVASFILPNLVTAAVLTVLAFGLLCVWNRMVYSARILAWTGLLIVVVSAVYTMVVIQCNRTTFDLPAAGTERFVESIDGTIASKVKRDGDRVSFVLRTSGGEKVQSFLYLSSEHESHTVQTWGRGDRLRLTGSISRPDSARNEGLFDYSRYLLRHRIHAILRVEGLSAVDWEAARLRSTGPHTMLLRGLDSMQDAMAAKLERIYPAAWGGLMRSLLVGDRSELDPSQFEVFAALGLTHLIAISGLHIGVWLAIWYGLLRRIGVPDEWVRACAYGLVPFYVLLTGAAPSAVRAGCMALVGLWFWKKRDRRGGLTAVALTACGMLMYDPYYLQDIGFQLSFTVTLSLLVAVPPLVRSIPLPGVGLRGFLAVSVVAQVASFPLVLYHFNSISLLSLPANLAVVPIFTGIVLPLGLASAAAALIWEPVGQWLSLPVSWMLSFVFDAAAWMEDMQLMLLVGRSPSYVWIILFWVTAACLLQFALRRKPLPTMLAGLSLLALVGFGFQAERWSRVGWVEFIDVGQGDAVLIRTPQGKVLLVDAGGTMQFGPQEAWRARRDPYEVGKDVIVPLLRKRGIAKLDAIIATHGDHDHIGGMLAVMSRTKVGTLILNGRSQNSLSSTALYEAATAEQIPIRIVEAGHVLQADARTELRVVWPNNSALVSDSENEHSVVLWMRMGEAKLLFAGDAGQVSESAWLSLYNSGDLIPACESKPVCGVDVLKVGHHGSRYASTREWLQYWQPKYAVISAGARNIYGHPHPDTLGRLKKAGAEIWRTDKHGGIRIIMEHDGRSLLIQSTLPDV